MKTKLKDIVLPDSGVALSIKRIGPMQLVDIRKKLNQTPRPKPPMQEVLIGDEKKLEPNESHPDYLAALAEHNTAIGVRYIEELVRRAVIVEFDADEVAELRAEADGDGLPADDKTLWVTRVAVTSDKDLKALQDAILGRAQPTEVAAQEAAESFPGQVQGA